MKDYIAERSISLAEYIIENKSTVRACAKHFGISKSTVHKDVTYRLPSINRPLAMKAREVLELNKATRHIRGGIATKNKYIKQREEMEKSGIKR